ncbi:uncharacterized protein LOC135156008 isoform X2 [Lytechinus pictus]|uniref:uncharacterized protein LOC135156008 isoform X2 n=1 Tax=Lytechinus pictus TaxID=7653 RepID=UPI0030B9C687
MEPCVIISLAFYVIFQHTFTFMNANQTFSSPPPFPSPLPNVTSCYHPLCTRIIQETQSLITLMPILNSTRQAINVTCPNHFMLIGGSFLECIDGHWSPPYESLHCAAPCTTWNLTLSAQMITQPPLPETGMVRHMSSFLTECHEPPPQPRGHPPRQEGPSIMSLLTRPKGELFCYDSAWFFRSLFRCENGTGNVPMAMTTEAMTTEFMSTSVFSTVGIEDLERKNCTGQDSGNITSVTAAENSRVPASIVYALSALACVLFLIVIVLCVALCRLRRNNKGPKRMQKSGFKDQLSIFQKPTPLNRPPKLPERPSTVGSVGSIRYQEHQPPKLPGQKIAEEEAEAKRIEAIRTEIYEQIGKRSDLPEYIDIYQMK